MLSPLTDLENMVLQLQDGDSPQKTLTKWQARQLMAKAIRCTHAVLHPGCDSEPANQRLRLVLLDLDRSTG